MTTSVQPSTDGQGTANQAKRWSRRLIIASILAVLLAMIVSGTSENIHSQMLKLGHHWWPDYFVLRGERPDASCDPNPNIEQRLDQLEAEFAADNADFDLFESTFDRENARESLLGQVRVCQKKHADLATYEAGFTDSVALFSKLEHAFADIALFAINHQKTFLILLLFLSAIVATAQKEYIAFRGIRTLLDHRMSNLVQIATYLCLLISTYVYYQGSKASGTQVLDETAMIALMLGSLALIAICAYHLFNPGDLRTGGKVSHALLAVPIHSYMLGVAAFHFFVTEQHIAGVAIYFTQVFQIANLHLAVGLYVLAGMLMKETHLGARTFDVLRPWRLPPEFAAFVAILLLAYPTAYTGASGIIIIAAGAVVYQEMRRVGARRQLSLAVTALTGSGVVLRPCLLVVGVAILNKEVVTDDLYHWGFYVFALSMLVFAFFAAITRREPLVMAPIREALPASLAMLKALLPYIAIFAFAMTFYGLALNTYLDEFNAQIVLPVIITLIILWERLGSKTFHLRNDDNVVQAAPTIPGAFSRAVHNSGVQIGGLLLLQACSYCVGGIIERQGSAMGLPELFGTPMMAMIVLMLLMVLIGMVMDPFGALIMVTGTLAPIAYASGIDPIHFWLMALMSFELGYVTPPVALNHLLARQVVGDREVELAEEDEKDTQSFYYKHERYILPMLVQGTTLLLVAFGPFMFYGN